MNKVMIRIPEWQGEFVYSKEVLLLVMTILLVIAGILLCFLGYQFFQTICFMGIAAAMLYIGYLLVELMTQNKVLQLFLSVPFAFFGVCMAYIVFVLLDYILRKLRVKDLLVRIGFLLTALLGGALLFVTIYFWIYRDMLIALIIGALMAVFGAIYQHVNQDKRIKYKTYGDIVAMKRPQEKEN